MIVGIGVDLVDIERFEAKIRQTPKLIERLFLPEERQLKPRSLAVRFAAKEAFVKAMGGSHGFGFQDLLVVGGGDTQPKLVLSGGAALAADNKGISNIQLSLSHDGGAAIAFVVLQ